MTVEQVCRQFSIAESTWARWLAQYGGTKAEDAKRLKELKGENARLKKLLAEAELDKLMLQPTVLGQSESLFAPSPRNVAVPRYALLLVDSTSPLSTSLSTCGRERGEPARLDRLTWGNKVSKGGLGPAR